MRKKNKFIFSLLLMCFIAIGLFPKEALGMEVSFAVTPSKIYDEQIELGATKSYVFYVANKSSGTNSDFTITTDISGSVENEFGESLDNTGVIAFDTEKVTLGLEEVKKITATVTIPKDYEIGSYKMYACFTQEPVPGFSMGEQTNVIKVPLYIFAGNKDEYSEKNVDFDILDSYLNYKDEPTTVLKESVKNCIKVLNPFNIPSVMQDIANRPVFNFDTKDGQKIDLNNDIYTKLKNVSTTKDKLSETKYVYYEKEWLNKKVENCENKKSSLNISLEDDIVLAIEGQPSSIEYIYSQLQTMAGQSKNLTLQDLFDNLQVPKNYTYEKVYPILVSEVKSNSDIPITLKGEYNTVKNNVDEVKSDTISSPTIMRGETIEVQNIIADKDLDKGSYWVSGTLKIRDKAQSFNYSFEVTKERNVILIAVISFLIMYLALIIVLIVVVIKFVRKRFNKYKQK